MAEISCAIGQCLCSYIHHFPPASLLCVTACPCGHLGWWPAMLYSNKNRLLLLMSTCCFTHIHTFKIVKVTLFHWNFLLLWVLPGQELITLCPLSFILTMVENTLLNCFMACNVIEGRTRGHPEWVLIS